ncbi:unnamed protein product [Phytophthora lilii]|uniref:Unnamed protein product n=1 Tax=Phytophthora lilii TaxID=2077276 RepID=A0A9W6YID1_9STRA|nr:unnamed protein product [Phytophthora lilii]
MFDIIPTFENDVTLLEPVSFQPFLSLFFFGIAFFLQSTMSSKAKDDMLANLPHKSARGKKSVLRSSSTLDKSCEEEQGATRTETQGSYLFNEF